MNMTRTFTLVLMLTAITSCGYNDPSDPINITNTVQCQTIDYKHGVYYFPCVKAEFGIALSTFKREHQTMRLAALAGDGTHGSGVDQGYWVVFEQQ